MNITVWSNFSKRINSTKQPAANTGTIKTVLLKDATDIEAPVFELNTVDFSINYVQAFGHYYFCDVRNLDGSRSELVCSMDHLATFKDNIKAYTGMVEYTSASSNVMITDPRNHPTIENKWASTVLSFGSNPFSGTGCYIISMVGKENNGILGFTNAYVCTQSQMRQLMNELMDQNIIQQITNELGDAMNAVTSCIWLPIDISQIPTQTQSLYYAGGTPIPNLDGQLNAMTSRQMIKTIALSSISFPYSGKSYLRKAPYSTGILYLPFVGYVPLDLDVFGDYPSIAIELALDFLTGDMVFTIYGGGDYSGSNTAKAIASYSGNCATKLPVSGASYDGVGVAAGALSAIGGAAVAVAGALSGGASGMIAKAAMTAAGGAALAFKSAEIHTMVNGNVSSAIGALSGGYNPISYICTQVPAVENLTAFQAKHGMPYFKVATLSSLSGYIQCADASVDIPGTAAEKNAVNGYLNSGFYLE